MTVPAEPGGERGAERGRVPTRFGHLACREDGLPDAPVLLLSNSLGTSLEMWEPQVVPLARHFRVVRYDQRGHGESSAPPGPYSIEDLGGDVIELLDGLGHEKVSYAGVSLGGMVGMWLAINAPDRIDRLVIASSAPYLGPPEAWHDRAETVRAAGTSSLTEAIFARWFTPSFHEAHPEVLGLFSSMLSAASDEGYSACCEAIAAMDQRDAIHSITAPTLVIAGADDPTTTPALALEMQQAIEGSSLVVLPRCAHIANVERAGEFTEAMLVHLAGTVFDRGLAVRRTVLGASYVDQALARAAGTGSAAVADFQRLITEFAWGSVWSRPGLDVATRRLVTIALLAALGRLDELELHARAAMEDRSAGGLDAEQIREVVLHTAVYAGAPAANSALGVIARVCEETGQ